jgi:hypothetical protein
MGEKEKQAGRSIAEDIEKSVTAVKAGKITRTEAVRSIADRLEDAGLDTESEERKDVAAGVSEGMFAISRESGDFSGRIKELYDIYGAAVLEMFLDLYPELSLYERPNPLDRPSIGPDLSQMPYQFRVGGDPMVREAANAEADMWTRQRRERFGHS